MFASCIHLAVSFVQEFCNGGSLRHAIAKGFFGPATLRNHWEVVLGVLSQVADAMSYLHSKRICHGDLNPANVLFKVRCPRLHLLTMLDFRVHYQACPYEGNDPGSAIIQIP